MSVQTAAVLIGYYNAARLLGDKSVSSDATLVIDGYEELSLLIKQFPWPVVGVLGEIEVPGPMGLQSWQPQALKTAFQGPLTLSETVSGSVATFLSKVAAGGAIFQATAYEGTPDAFHYAWRLRNGFFVPDAPDRDWENRSQITSISGTYFFHFFGEKIAGNILV